MIGSFQAQQDREHPYPEQEQEQELEELRPRVLRDDVLFGGGPANLLFGPEL